MTSQPPKTWASKTSDNTMERCAYCEEEREELYPCEDCGDKVCEDCCAVYDQFTQIDYPLCKSCETNREAAAASEHEKEWQRQEAADKKRAARAAAARKRYWLPEQVAKRAERKRERAARKKAMYENAAREVAGVLRNWFR